MTKLLIDLDDDLLAAAREALGTASLSDTIPAALQQSVSIAARAEEVAWLSAGNLEAMPTREARAAVWR